ncbi:hypothetical protein [Geomonas ferrireducens]|uniref:hypothetical protein n=1 Tax=Geomonas ferrireducens TaxID=2570227 RepID=UPI0010A8238A|nr:hypothetical protein [Geomonas ferrireducens]
MLLRPLTLLVLVVFMLAAVPAAEAARRGTGSAGQTATIGQAEVLSDFETILDLWRDGKYEDLYQRTTGGKDSKEKFTAKLSSAPRKPACCWEKIQEPRVTMKSAHSAVVHARLGFEASTPGTEFVTKGINLKKEPSGWSISQSDLYSLADLTGKKRRYRYIPVQPVK